jgi:hypothetical protein
MNPTRVPADVVVRNAAVHALDPARLRAEAFAVRDRASTLGPDE